MGRTVDACGLETRGTGEGKTMSTGLKRFRWMGVVALPLLAACSVGPNYHPQQASIQVPEAWPVIPKEPTTPPVPPINPTVPTPPTTPPNTTPPKSTPPAPTTGVLPPDVTPVGPVEGVSITSANENLAEWWTVFNDPVLNKLVTDTLTTNLTLRAAELRVCEARATRGIVASALFPQINYDGSAETSRVPLNIPKRGLIGNTSNFFQHGLDATWELDFFGGTRRAIESAEANIDASIEDRRNIMVTLAGEVGLNYVSLRGFQKQLAIARDNVDSQQKNAELIKKKFQAGLSNKLDYANAVALMATTRASIPPLETAAQQAIYALAVLLGREPAALDAELNKDAPIPPPPPSIPAGLPSDLIRRRPDVRTAEARIHAATAEIGVAKADLFPKFSLTGNSGFQGQKQSALVTWAHRTYSFGPSVDWPIFAAGKIGCNIELQKWLEQEAKANYRQTVLSALQDVDSALFALAKEKDHRQALDDAVKSFKEVVTLSMKLYTDGNSDYLNVITAERSLYLAQDALAQSERDMSLDVVAVYKALGGGWCEPDVIEAVSVKSAVAK